MITCNLRILRAIKDISRLHLSQKLNIRYSTLAAIEKNKTSSIPVEILDKLCEEFDCQIDDLYEHTLDKNTHREKRPYGGKHKEGN